MKGDVIVSGRYTGVAPQLQSREQETRDDVNVLKIDGNVPASGLGNGIGIEKKLNHRGRSSGKR